MSTNIFEFATRNKLLFSSSRGALNTEQLWDVPLRSRDDFNLNAIAQAANKALKGATEESFVETKRTTLHVRLETTLEIVKHVIDAKLAEEAAAKKQADNKAERERLLAILADKQDSKLVAESEEQIKARIAALE